MSNYILSIDQGTSSSRAIIFNDKGEPQLSAQREFGQIYPKSGWVEHDPQEIWETVHDVCANVLEQNDKKISCIGITNQRETTIIWDRKTGEPIYNAIVWQDRRTSNLCKVLKEDGHEKLVTEKTGLLLDPYFSATKIKWILDNVDGARARAENGDLAFGTVDTYLIWKLTNGAEHATDATNASRTMIYNIYEGKWDEDLLQLFDIPASLLPAVKNSSDDYGVTDLFGASIQITGVAGDQQAATVGQACFEKGMVKATYGTGCFVMVNTGESPVVSNHRLLTTIAYQLDGKVTYALEGSIFSAGSIVKWLRDSFKIISEASETGPIAESLKENDGVYLVPAFTGLGAPYWDPEAKAAILGITPNTGPEHVVRAALESISYQTHDLMAAISKDGINVSEVRVDGGMTANDWLMQFLANVLNVKIDKSELIETTCLGAAYLAGVQVGIYETLKDISQNRASSASFVSEMDGSNRQELLESWSRAVDCVRSF